MLVLHDDAKREDAYGLPKGFPTRVGIFTQDSRRGWIVISMKDDWKRLRHYGRAKGPTYRSVKNGAFSTSGMGQKWTWW
jgi:hypothetical protein